MDNLQSPTFRRPCNKVLQELPFMPETSPGSSSAGKAPQPVEGKTQQAQLPPVRLKNGRMVGGLHPPPTAAESSMDVLDFANLKIFGNHSFRPEQRRVVEAVLRVWMCCG